MNTFDLLIVLATAFFGSIGHCIGMCGGIVVAYTSSKIDPKSSYLQQTASHLAYNFGRVATYTIMGALFGLLGKVIAFTPTTKGVLFVLTGIFMILAGLSLLGSLKFLNSAEWSVTKYPWFQKTFKKLIHDRSYLSFFLLGMLNGMIPCGLVYSFALIAASTASPLWGAIVMAVFGLATIPTLFFLGNITKFLQQGSLRNIMMKIAALLVIFYGVFIFYKGYHFVTAPQEMEEMLQKMHTNKLHNGKCGAGMKCAPGKCG